MLEHRSNQKRSIAPFLEWGCFLRCVQVSLVLLSLISHVFTPQRMTHRAIEGVRVKLRKPKTSVQ